MKRKGERADQLSCIYRLIRRRMTCRSAGCLKIPGAHQYRDSDLTLLKPENLDIFMRVRCFNVGGMKTRAIQPRSVVVITKCFSALTKVNWILIDNRGIHSKSKETNLDFAVSLKDLNLRDWTPFEYRTEMTSPQTIVFGQYLF